MRTVGWVAGAAGLIHSVTRVAVVLFGVDSQGTFVLAHANCETAKRSKGGVAK